MNTTTVPESETAQTDYLCAEQRAENLALLGAVRVLELCVGPSLENLEQAYSKYCIEVVGNDIDPRWKDYYPDGNWLIGDCFDIDWSGFDTVVFAPPLSRGCTGKREDALKINEVFPRYIDFMAKRFTGLRCMVLPARSFATKYDREEFYHLLYDLNEPEVDVLRAKRGIRKYVDVYYRD